MTSELSRGIAILNSAADPAFMPNRDYSLLSAVQAEGARLEPILLRYDALLSRVSPAVYCQPDPGDGPHHLRWMIQVLLGKASEAGSSHLTPLKMHRWLGFIQGTMIARGVLTVPEERELTRQYLTEH